MFAGACRRVGAQLRQVRKEATVSVRRVWFCSRIFLSVHQ